MSDAYCEANNPSPFKRCDKCHKIISTDYGVYEGEFFCFACLKEILKMSKE